MSLTVYSKIIPEAETSHQQVQASTAYLDRHYGVGEESRQLLLGYDCPYGALTLNASYHTEDEYYTSPGAICIFEVNLL